MSHSETLTVKYRWQSVLDRRVMWDTELEARAANPNPPRFSTLLRLFLDSNGRVMRTEKIQVS